MIFFPQVQRKFPLLPRFSTISPLYSRFFSVNHHIFSPTNQYFIFCPPPPPGGGQNEKLHPWFEIGSIVWYVSWLSWSVTMTETNYSTVNFIRKDHSTQRTLKTYCTNHSTQLTLKTYCTNQSIVYIDTMICTI